MALAQLYREWRKPDQAGRWGIAVPDWTNERERELFKRALVAGGDLNARRVRHLLDLPPSAALPDELESLVEGKGTWEPPQWSEKILPIAVGLAVVSCVTWVLGAGVVYTQVWAGGGDLRLVARYWSVAVVYLEVASLVAAFLYTAVRRRWLLSAMWLLLAVMAAIIAGYLTVDPGRPLFWES